MRERIIRELRRAAEQSTFDRARWAAIRDRLADIQISTIDAFCLSLLREFPLEADLDPGFGMADETEVPRLVDQSLDKSLATFVGAGEARARHGARAGAARADAHARGPGLPAAAPARRVGRARSLPRARPRGSRRRRRLPPRGRRARSICSATVSRADARSSWPKGRSASRATSCWRRICRRLESFTDRRQRRRSRPDEPRRGALPQGGRQAAHERSDPSRTRTTTIRRRRRGSAIASRRCGSAAGREHPSARSAAT